MVTVMASASRAVAKQRIGSRRAENAVATPMLYRRSEAGVDRLMHAIRAIRPNAADRMRRLAQ